MRGRKIFSGSFTSNISFGLYFNDLPYLYLKFVFTALSPSIFTGFFTQTEPWSVVTIMSQPFCDMNLIMSNRDECSNHESMSER